MESKENKIKIGKDPATRSQIIGVMLLTIIKYCFNHAHYVTEEDEKKIQEMFNIVNR